MGPNEGLGVGSNPAVLFLTVFVVCLTVPVASLGSDGDTLAVRHVDTPVKYRPADSTRWRSLSETTADVPESGDFLVEEEGSVELKADDSEVHLNEKSGMSYRLADDTAGEVRLNHGSMKAEVDSETQVKQSESDKKKEKLKLETPMGSLGIRGTEFGVSFEQSGRSEVYVDTGEVVLRTDRDRTEVSEEEYVAFGQRGVEPTNRILDRGGLPDRYQVTWNRWSLRRQIRELERQREKLRRRIKRESPTNKERSSSLRRKLEQLEEKLSELRKQYRPLKKEYESYRKRLEKKRGDFIRQRKQAFDEYRRRRMREMREMQRDREEGMEQMRREREEALSR